MTIKHWLSGQRQSHYTVPDELQAQVKWLLCTIEEAPTSIHGLFKRPAFWRSIKKQAAALQEELSRGH